MKIETTGQITNALEKHVYLTTVRVQPRQWRRLIIVIIIIIIIITITITTTMKTMIVIITKIVSNGNRTDWSPIRSVIITNN